MGKANRIQIVCLSLVILVAASAVAPARADDWPQFRGPGRDGISEETGLLSRWPDGGPEEVWRKPLGSGYSGISVVGEKIYTAFAAGEAEFAICMEAATGKEVWRAEIGKTFRNSFGDGPRSTPTVDRGLVFALSGGGQLHALKAEDGESVWSKDLVKEFGAKAPRWGVSTSPLVEGDLLLVDAGGKEGNSVVALNRKTGEKVWSFGDDKAGYSSAMVVTVNKVRQLIYLTGTRLVSLSPEDGSLYFELPWKTSYDVNAATPVFIPPDGLFVSTGYDVGAALYRIEAEAGKATASEVWKGRQMKNKFSSSVHVEGKIFGFDEKNLTCLDAESGELKWRKRGFGHGSLFWAEGLLVVLSDEGELALVEADEEAYIERGRATVFDGRSWTVPTLASGKLFLRDETEIVALDVAR